MKRKSGQVHFYALGVGLDSGEEPTDLTWQTFKDICFLIRFHVDWIAKKLTSFINSNFKKWAWFCSWRVKKPISYHHWERFFT